MMSRVHSRKTTNMDDDPDNYEGGVDNVHDSDDDGANVDEWHGDFDDGDDQDGVDNVNDDDDDATNVDDIVHMLKTMLMRTMMTVPMLMLHCYAIYLPINDCLSFASSSQTFFTSSSSLLSWCLNIL